jgi:hypothetical protein
MKTIFKISAIFSLFLLSCTSLQRTSVTDDLYYTPGDEVSSKDLYASENNETGKNKSYVQNKELDKKISDLLADESKEVVDTTIYEDDKTGNPYQDIIVDNYDEAYQKRLEARQSGYYGITNSYFVMNSSDYWYASAYLNDPFYNVIIVGDQVWVEPVWVSTSFGYNRYGSWYHGYYGSYYSYYPYANYYNPGYYYSPYYNYYPYLTLYDRWVVYRFYDGNIYDNDNWAGSSLNSYRRRGNTTTNPAGLYRNERSSRLPETYMGSDIRRNRTLKEGLDAQSGTNLDRRTERTREKRENVSTDNIQRTARVVDKERERNTNNDIVRRDITQKRTGSSTANETYTRTTRQGSSTYDASKRTNSTRYTRPEKSSGESSGTRSGTSTYSPGRSSGSTSKSGGSTYTPARSSGNSGSNVKSTPSRSDSGSSRSSGSSGGSNSSGSSNSSGGSRSSSGSDRGGRR